jgi:glucokinase
MNQHFLLGIDIGGTKCAAVIGDKAGVVYVRSEWLSLAEQGPGAMLVRIVGESRKLLAKYRAEAVGVSIGGPLNSREGIIYSPPNLPGWDAFPLKAALVKEFSLPVNIEHDAAACAFAEYLWGAGSEAENLAYLTCGTGFGSGYVFGGKIHRGARGGSCEVGHIGLRDEGPIAFGKKGSAEAYGSGTALTLLAAWRFPQRWGGVAPSGAELAQLARQGDADAGEILRLNADAVGEVAAILADALGLDLVLIGSLARYLGEPWLEEVRRSFATRVLPSIGNKCFITGSGLAERLQDCSALAAALAAA